MSVPTNFPLSLGAMAVAAALLAGCGKPPGQLPGPPQETPSVGVVVVQPQRVVITTELPGRTAPFLIAEVRPQVGGIVKTRSFREGSDVKAGQALYQIDAATYQASYNSSLADLAKAQASLKTTRLKAGRYKELVAIQAVSQQDYDDAAALLAQGEAEVASAKANVETGRINLAHAQVQAPISGRIGRSSVTPGALVTASQQAALATVQQLDPIYVDVTQPSASLLRLKQAMARGDLQKSGADAARVKLLLEDGSTYPLEGKLQFSDVTVDQSTGAITLRAVFPNPKADLLPGMYVRAVLEEGVQEQGLLVPQPAVSRDSTGKPTAYVVSADNKLQKRMLETERTVGDQWLVRSGLKAGDQLVVDGQQRAKEGAEVKTVPWAPKAGGAPQAATPAASAPAALAPVAVPAPKANGAKIALN